MGRACCCGVASASARRVKYHAAAAGLHGDLLRARARATSAVCAWSVMSVSRRRRQRTRRGGSAPLVTPPSTTTTLTATRTRRARVQTRSGTLTPSTLRANRRSATMPLALASALAFATLLAPSLALDNGMARTPPMGWNSWMAVSHEALPAAPVHDPKRPLTLTRVPNQRLAGASLKQTCTASPTSSTRRACRRRATRLSTRTTVRSSRKPLASATGP